MLGIAGGTVIPCVDWPFNGADPVNLSATNVDQDRTSATLHECNEVMRGLCFRCPYSDVPSVFFWRLQVGVFTKRCLSKWLS